MAASVLPLWEEADAVPRFVNILVRMRDIRHLANLK